MTRVALLLTAALCLFVTILSAQTTWTGATDNDWSNPANWTNGSPTSGNDATIPMGMTPVLSLTADYIASFNTTNGGALTVQLNGFTWVNNGTFQNEGTLNVAGVGSFTNHQTIINNGTLTTDAMMVNNYGGQLTNSGELNINNVFVNYSVITNTGTVNLNADFDNVVNITNSGGATWNNAANFENLNSSTFTNQGTINNTVHWTNRSTLDNEGTFNNQGELLNEPNGTIDNTTSGQLINSDLVYNQGTLTNAGTVQNTSCNTYRADNNSVHNNTGTFENNGIARQLGNADIGINSGTGTLLTNLTDLASPMMQCADDFTIVLDAEGAYTITVEDIDDGSTVGYCTIQSRSINTSDFDCNSLGQNVVQLTVVDAFDIPAFCTTTVTVQDSEAPTLNCPTDINYVISPGECDDAIVDYTVTASDNCNVTLTQTDGTGLTAGDAFPNGTTIQTYEATDGINTVECTFNVNMFGAHENGGLSCLGQVNVSLDENCEYTFTANSLLSGPLVCNDYYSIEINDIAMTDIDETFIGENLMVAVINIETGVSCWGLALVEDKLPPIIVSCEDVELYCFENTDPETLGGDVPVPTATDCSDFDLFYIDEIIQGGCDVDYKRITTRTWTAVDAHGRTSTCEQVITINKISPTDNPPQCPVNFLAECTAGEGLDISPEVTGAPTIEVGGRIFTLTEENDELCDFGVTYDDLELDVCDGSYKVVRTWKVYYWCAEIGTSTNPWTCTQMIHYTDETAPEITPPNDITVSVNADCKAFFNIPPASYDDCSSEVAWKTLYSLGLYDGNGGTVAPLGLGLGVEEITFIATDACGNTSSATMTVTIVDTTTPTAICEADLEVSLADGYASISATNLDGGSTDNCCIADLQIMRMEDACDDADNLVFHHAVTFCCADAGQYPMVILKVIDCSGNENSCMAAVNVVDGDPPIIICGPDKDVECNQDYTDLAITGEPFISDNCGEPTLTYEDSGVVACNGGTIIRTFTATDGSGNTATCSQTINVLAPDVLTEVDITCPENYTATGCSPDISPEVAGMPQVDLPACVEVDITYEDFEYVLNTEEYCSKIIRTWSITDACVVNNEPNTTFQCFQTIFISQTAAPEIICPANTPQFCASGAACTAQNVNLNILISDDCTAEEELQIFWTVDLYNDGVAETGELASGAGMNTSQNYPIGTHEITYKVKDECGNVATCTYLFIVNDCSVPMLSCVPTLTADVTTSVTAGQFVTSSYNTCTGSGNLTYSFSNNVNNTTRSFTCNQVGQIIPTTIFVTNNEGEQGTCNTSIEVVDNTNNCMSNLMIAGAISTESGEMLENVAVEIISNAAAEAMTNQSGHYEYAEGNYGENYTVVPQSDTDWMNGISTWDLVLIRKHILDISPIENPYQLIAADVNNTQSVTTADIIALRSVILQLADSFANNTSWRFVDANYEFADNTNPWAQPFPELVTLNPLSDDMMYNDFIAIKVGDINGTATGQGLTNELEERNDKTAHITIKDQQLEAGELVSVRFDIDDAAYAYQMTLDYDVTALEFVELEAGQNHTRADFGLRYIDEGAITCSWDKLLYTAYEDKNASYFSVLFKANQAIALSEALNVNSRFTQAMAYQEDGTEMNIALEITNKLEKKEDFVLHQNQPNPFKTETTISFNLPEATEVRLSVHDVIGKQLFEQQIVGNKGYNEITLPAANLPKGVLYYSIATATQQASKKMIITK